MRTQALQRRITLSKRKTGALRKNADGVVRRLRPNEQVEVLVLTRLTRTTEAPKGEPWTKIRIPARELREGDAYSIYAPPKIRR
jgi:hypothetical protein